MNTDLRYPVGRFHQAGPVTAQQKEQWLSEIEELPEKLKAALDGLSDAQLNEPYRPGGWTVKQVAHHLADSHMNSFIRFKLALTEENPAIKPYEEQLWAELPDTLDTPVFVSVALLTALHERWTVLLRSMSEGQYARTFFHPASKQISRLDVALGMYAWHGRHHVAHVTSLRERMGWQ
ncbi:YfiT family bacillithiol transferase [Cohnella suwonensis]|uniref:Putative metal-dependent hydrolase ACFPPD_02320 n=1 Tax=Cohnella suwonensis TaxID=696072 RepID=A0ABW0LNQ8_9BACL